MNRGQHSVNTSIQDVQDTSEYDIVSKNPNRGNATNPYSKKFLIKRKLPKRVGTQQSQYERAVNSALEHHKPSQYSVASSFSKKQSADVTQVSKSGFIFI